MKKSSILLVSYSNFHGLCSPHPYSSTNFAHHHEPRTNRTATYLNGGQKTQRRGFADVHASNCSSGEPNDLHWPVLPSATAIPTPYQIFKQKKSAPYSKSRFYELVKLYHPDRQACTASSANLNFLSHAAKLERYRLIVAANDILSDPVKRIAYDRYGAGWNGQPEVGRSNHKWDRAAGTGWSGFDTNASPAQNATWEDWERWYRRDAKGKQEPLYFSNGGFVSLIVVVAALGGIGTATRVGEHSRTFMEQIEIIHDDCSKDIQRRRKESLGAVNKDERIQSFLRTRDPFGHGMMDLQEEACRQALPPPLVKNG
ncbi:hypothetical protein MMC12_000801 [Toensbergia leucococca]|nr:hypothetical protein [Toensbergia leucococca]